MPAGGYQQPRKPASVSGPGALSRRTDGGPAKKAADAAKSGGSGHRAGGSRPMQRLLSTTPLPETTGGNPPSPDKIAQAAAAVQNAPPQPAPPPDMELPQPLSAGTILPDQPVTHGAPAGEGDNSIPGLQPPNAGAPYKTAADQLRVMAQATGNPDLHYLAGLAGG